MSSQNSRSSAQFFPQPRFAVLAASPHHLRVPAERHLPIFDFGLQRLAMPAPLFDRDRHRPSAPFIQLLRVHDSPRLDNFSRRERALDACILAVSKIEQRQYDRLAVDLGDEPKMAVKAGIGCAVQGFSGTHFSLRASSRSKQCDLAAIQTGFYFQTR